MLWNPTRRALAKAYPKPIARPERLTGMPTIRPLFAAIVVGLAATLNAGQEVDISSVAQKRGRALLDAALDATGGLERLQQLNTVRLREVGRHQWVYQSAQAQPPWRQGDREELTVLDRGAQRLLTQTKVTHPAYYFGWPGVIVAGTSGHTLDHYSRMITPIARTSLDAYRFFPEGIAFDGNRLNRTAATALLVNYLAPSESADEKMVSQNFASWNQLDGWLRQVESLRRAA